MQDVGWNAAPPRRRTPIADLFDETFGLYRRHLALVIGFTALFTLPILLVSAPFQAWQLQFTGAGTDPFGVGDPARAQAAARQILEALPLILGGTLLFVVVSLVLSTFAFAAVTYVAGRGRQGDRPTAGEVLSALRRLAGPLIGYTFAYFGLIVLLTVLAVLAFVLLVAIFAAVGGRAGIAFATFFSILFLIALIIAVIAVTVRLAVAIPALVHERLGGIASLRRSWELVRGSMWRTFAILLLVGLVIGVLSIVVTAFLPIQGVLAGSVVDYVVATLLLGAVQLVLGPISPILMTVLFFDLARGDRVRA